MINEKTAIEKMVDFLEDKTHSQVDATWLEAFQMALEKARSLCNEEKAKAG